MLNISAYSLNLEGVVVVVVAAYGLLVLDLFVSAVVGVGGGRSNKRSGAIHLRLDECLDGRHVAELAGNDELRPRVFVAPHDQVDLVRPDERVATLVAVVVELVGHLLADYHLMREVRVVQCLNIFLLLLLLFIELTKERQQQQHQQQQQQKLLV